MSARQLIFGGNPIGIQRGSRKPVAAAGEYFSRIAQATREKEEIKQVAAASANWDNGVGAIITLEVVQGMQFDNGYLSPRFVTDPETMEARLRDAYILTYEKKISSRKELFPLLEKVAAARKALLIITEEAEGEALSTLVSAQVRSTIKVCAVKAPGSGDRRNAMLEDIAILTGARCITGELGIELETVRLEDLGSAGSIVVNRESTTIVSARGAPSAIQARIHQIRCEIEEATANYDRENLQERLAKLAGGVAVVKFGATQETLPKVERFRKIND